MKIKLTGMLLSAIILVGCGGGSDGDIVINEVQTIQENQYVTYTLSSGTYEAEIAASNNGIVVEWIGSTNCNKSSEVKTYSHSCTLNQQGQLKISNPTLLGLGGSEVVNTKVTKM